MKLWTLMENTTAREELSSEHGLSFYLETENHQILFDMGQTAAFADNAEKLGIDLRQVDLAVLSHGHYDHGGGLAKFLEINDRAKVYLSRHAFMPHYNGTEKYIGLDPALAASDRLILVDDMLEIDEALSLYSCNSYARSFDMDTAGLNMAENGVLLPDDFRHEQYLLIREKGKKILISGCSHKGILNIAEWFRPDVLIGGFHFKSLKMTAEDRRFLEQTAEQLMAFPTRYYTCHCTGAEPYAYLKQRMGEQLQYLSVGTYLEY